MTIIRARKQVEDLMTTQGMDTAVAALRQAGLMPTRERLLVAGLVFSGPLITLNPGELRERALDQGLYLSEGEVGSALAELSQAGVLPKMMSGSGASPANLRRIAAALQAMGNHHRLLVLVELAQGERSVGELRRAVGLRPSALSQHLAKLRIGGLVRTRRDATRIYYSLHSPEVLTVLRGFGCLSTKSD